MLPQDVYYLAMQVRDKRKIESRAFLDARRIKPDTDEWKEFKDKFESARNARTLAEIALATRVLTICGLSNSVEANTAIWKDSP